MIPTAHRKEHNMPGMGEGIAYIRQEAKLDKKMAMRIATR